MVKQIRFDGGGNKPVSKSTVAKPAQKTNGQKARSQGANGNEGTARKRTNKSSGSKADAVRRAKTEMSLRHQGKIGGYVHLDDALGDMGYDAAGKARVKGLAGNKSGRDLYNDYFVNPHFSDGDDD